MTKVVKKSNQKKNARAGLKRDQKVYTRRAAGKVMAMTRPANLV
jgi:hypothetical protein